LLEFQGAVCSIQIEARKIMIGQIIRFSLVAGLCAYASYFATLSINDAMDYFRGHPMLDPALYGHKMDMEKWLEAQMKEIGIALLLIFLCFLTVYLPGNGHVIFRRHSKINRKEA
jgi:uncharacterized protein involved in cysteine biosynthesis